MRWGYWVHSLLLACTPCKATMSKERIRQLRELTRETFYHAYNSYLHRAFPADEIRPVSCRPLGPDRSDPKNIDLNDVLGDYSLTLVDSLDTFVVLGDKSTFESAVRLTIQHVRFDNDVKIQVFESTIRMLGGLLSAHIFASEPEHGFAISWYKGELLWLAQDLGRRLLPAFHYSRTGIPYARINLKTGLQQVESIETCSAGAGSLILEFITLSRLTGQEIFEQVARKAFWAIWNRRSDLGLIGNTINLQNGNWIYGVSSVGAGIDSFFEYMLKAYVLFGEDEYYRAWKEAHGAIMKYVREPTGFWFRSVNMQNGQIQSLDVDSLSAFWPGVLVMAGDVQGAIKNHLAYANLWKRFGGIPESFNVHTKEATNANYPLRPEFIESNYFLYRATKDPFYLQMAEQVIMDLINRTRVDCGLAGVADLRTGKLDDRMHSFALGETLKYLFLTFDEDNRVNKDDSNMVFTTEGHLIPLNKRYLRQPVKSDLIIAEAGTCSVPDPLYMHKIPILQPSVSKRVDAEYARFVVNLTISEEHAMSSGLWDVNGICELPQTEAYTIDLIFSNSPQSEDPLPNHSKVLEVDGGLYVTNVQGLRFQLTRLSDGSGYDVIKVGPYNVESGSKVMISDPSLVETVEESTNVVDKVENIKALLRFTFTMPDKASVTFIADGIKATFGPDVHHPPSDTSFGSPNHPLPLTNMLAIDYHGCRKYKRSDIAMVDGGVAVVRRGGCSFSRKMRHAADAGAKGLLVWNEEDTEFLPADDPSETMENMIPLLMIGKTVGSDFQKLWKMGGKIKVEVEQELLEDTSRRGKRDVGEGVYIDGYFLRNVEIHKSSIP